jgi:hypothetical protein
MSYQGGEATLHNLIIVGISILMAYALFWDEAKAEFKQRKKNIQPLFCEPCDKHQNFIIIDPHVYECPTCANVIDLSR